MVFNLILSYNTFGSLLIKTNLNGQILQGEK